MKFPHFSSRALPALAGLCMIGMVACNKEKISDTIPTDEVEIMRLSSEDDAGADNVFNEIHDLEMGMIVPIGLPDIGLSEVAVTELDSVGRCAKVTVTPRDPNVFPKTVVFDFGEGCRALDGKLRKGKVIVRYSAPMRKPGAVALTTFENFSIDGNKIEGNHSTKNNSTSTTLIFTRRVENGKITFAGGGVVIWDATHTNTQKEGLGTPGFPLDDVFEITGGAKGISERNGKRVEWSRRIAEPLVKSFTCRWISKGVVHITRNDKRAVLNFGDGTCDNKAVLLINGERKEITL